MASTTRQALLQALSAAEGAYISGQQLAQQLGVSRAAVHKAAAALTAQGYALEAASRRGYRLLGGDPFCTEAVGPYPAPVQLYDTLESTNRTAKLLALEGAAHGTLVLAGGQTAGRGRLGRSFASPAGKGGVLLGGAAPAAACRQRPDRHHRRGSGSVPGGADALRAGACHQVGERPVLQGQKGVRHPDRGRYRP